ncbi:MAG: hypothetical protein ACI3ZG_08035 [Candidatus Coprenecus sp.]
MMYSNTVKTVAATLVSFSLCSCNGLFNSIYDLPEGKKEFGFI